MGNELLPLQGFDNRSKVYLRGKMIIRDIEPTYWAELTEVLEILEEQNYYSQGIQEVAKFEDEQLGSNCLIQNYLKLTYPNEWSVSMFREAAIFTLALMKSLEKNSLTLKDALPENIVFDGVQPKFVDITSVIFKSKLLDEEWLVKNKKLRNKETIVLTEMFVPFFLIPLLVAQYTAPGKMRKLLTSHFCNSGLRSPKLFDLLKFGRRTPGQVVIAIRVLMLNRYLNRNSLISSIQKIESFINLYVKQGDHSAYSTYYDDKEENQSLTDESEWNEKQKSVSKILGLYSNKSILDLGANTGWYSLLGAARGCSVVSTDIDEACLNILFEQSKKNRKIDNVMYLDVVEEICGHDLQGRMSFGARNNPEIVLILGLLHHLVLGRGITIESAMRWFSSITTEALLVEFVELEDGKIMLEPDFFPNLEDMKPMYSLDLLLQVALSYFKSVEILNSTPNTRRLLYFKEKLIN